MAALHEAGHAIVAIALGWRPARARIADASRRARADDRDGDFESRGRRIDSSDALERKRMLACMLGGLEAERRRSHRSVLALCAFGGAGGDYNAAVALIAAGRSRSRHPLAREPNADEVAEELERARRFARDLVRLHWRAVERVADRLSRTGQLDGAEILAIALRADPSLRRGVGGKAAQRTPRRGR